MFSLKSWHYVIICVLILLLIAFFTFRPKERTAHELFETDVDISGLSEAEIAEGQRRVKGALNAYIELSIGKAPKDDICAALKELLIHSSKFHRSLFDTYIYHFDEHDCQ